MRNEIIIAVVLMFLFMGTASAGSVSIEPNDEIIILTVGQDAFDTEGLSVVYEGMSAGSKYSVVIRRGDYNETGVIVYTVPNFDGTQGPLTTTPNFTQEVHWTPTDQNDYTIYATGASASGNRRISAEALINPVPEISTIVLTSAGILGLIGLTRMRRKD